MLAQLVSCATEYIYNILVDDDLLTPGAHVQDGYSTHFVCLSTVFWLHKIFIQHFDNENSLCAKRKRFLAHTFL